MFVVWCTFSPRYAVDIFLKIKRKIVSISYKISVYVWKLHSVIHNIWNLHKLSILHLWRMSGSHLNSSTSINPSGLLTQFWIKIQHIVSQIIFLKIWLNWLTVWFEKQRQWLTCHHLQPEEMQCWDSCRDFVQCLPQDHQILANLLHNRNRRYKPADLKHMDNGHHRRTSSCRWCHSTILVLHSFESSSSEEVSCLHLEDTIQS